MAGQRKAQYVSIPLGPGVLSNTTGRGARTRINYMNWDRWKDSTWVRWHKLLPEKQGGWQYQALLGEQTYQTLVPGAPTLLLHLNAVAGNIPCSLLLHMDPVTLTWPVAILLHMDGTNGSTSFPDSGPNNLTVTANGTAQVTTSSPEFGTGALITPLATDSISVPCPASGPLDLTSGDFTIEFWYWPTSVSSVNCEIFEIGMGPSYLDGGIMLYQTGSPDSSQLDFQLQVVPTGLISGSSPGGSLIANAWNAIAFCRQGNRFYMFVNGVGSALGAPTSSPLLWGGGTMKLGHGLWTNTLAGNKFDDLRITKGVALYTANYTPSGPLTSPATQPNILEFIDSSVNNYTMTPTTAVVSTSNPKFGAGEGSFPGGGGTSSELTTPAIVAGGPLDLFGPTGGDFTIEGWFMAPAFGAVFTIVDYGNMNGGSPGVVISVPNSTDIQISTNVSGWSGFSNTVATLLANTWYAFALVRHGAVATFYLNGTALGTTATNWGTNSPTSPTGVLFGGAPSVTFAPFNLDEVRVSKAAVYTSNYAPAGPLSPNIGGSTLVPSDASFYNWPMTASSTATSDSATPKFGNGALQSDGATAEVSTPVTVGTPLDLSQTDFTLEFWIYPTSAVLGLLFDASNGDTAGFYLEYTAAGTVKAFIWTGSSYGNITSGAVALNTWTDVALVRQGGTFTLYIGGVSAGTLSYAGNIGPAGGSMAVAGGWTTSFAGAIDEVRLTRLALYTTTYTPATAENTLGLPNTTGSSTPPSGFSSSIYAGLARDLHDWSSLDGQYWIAIGTNLKLYVVNQGTLYDITPQRKTSNVVNALTTFANSNIVSIVDPGHQANSGDFIDIIGASPVGGLQLLGSYELSVIDPNTYTIFAASPAVSSATGGGNFSIAYEITTGLPANGQLLGYGTGLYGAGTYGTARAIGTGVFARMRTWSLDNYGQDLIASQSDGEIYWWQRNTGPNSRAGIIPLAPTGCQRVIVDAQQRVIIALGCTDVTSAFDPLLVRWCSFDDITDWVPTDINTAGDDLLTAGSRIVTGLKTKGQNLIWTDTTLYRMVFVGEPDEYDFIPAGGVTIVGPNAAVDVDGVAYFWGFDNFYNYSGTLNLQACDVWETVFDPSYVDSTGFHTALNRAQSEGVVCYTYEPKTEITWLYQSIDGAFTVTFNGILQQWATSGSLTTAWTGRTGYYELQFSDQESRPVLLTNGQTNATWNLPLVSPIAAGTALFIGNDRYVTFNWEDGTWFYGYWQRTCAAGRAPAMNGYPYGVNAGYLYQHEVGIDAVEAFGTQAIGFFMKSLDITVGGAKSEYTMGGSDARFAIGGSDSHLLIRSMLPDWAYMTGSMNLTLLTKDRPQDQTYVQEGPVLFTETTGQIDIDAHGSQVVIQLDNYTGPGGAPSLGSSFRMGIWQGLATPYAKR